MKATIRSAKRIDGIEPTWKLAFLDSAERDGRKFLNDDQYAHVVGLFDELAYEQNPLDSQTQDVRNIDSFYELRDKGGILGKINVRVYFNLVSKHKLIIVLAAYKKEDEGATPTHIVIKARNRFMYWQSQKGRQRW